jgi:hypothetical protein
VLLNFPSRRWERLELGPGTRRQWAEARLAERFSKRVPASVNLAITEAGAEADRYIARYNIWMHHLVDVKGTRLFPPKMRLLSHWNLRDQIRADYSDRNGLPKQRLIAQVMDRIVTQTIPAAVVDNPYLDWDPFSNAQGLAEGLDMPTTAETRPPTRPSPTRRYAMLVEDLPAAPRPIRTRRPRRR